MLNKHVSFALVICFLAVFCAAESNAQTYNYSITNNGSPAYGSFIRVIDNPNMVWRMRIRRNIVGTDDLNNIRFNPFMYYDIPETDMTMGLWHDVNSDGQLDAMDTHLTDADVSKWGDPWYEGVFTNFSLSCPFGVDVFIIVSVTLALNVPIGAGFDLYLYHMDFAAGSTSGYNLFGSPVLYVGFDSAHCALNPGFSLPAGNVAKGAVSQPLLQFNITQDLDGEPPPFYSVTVHGDTSASGGHTAVAADVSQLRLYQETGQANGVVDHNDVLLDVAAYLGSNFNYFFEFSGSGLAIPTTGMNCLVVADVAPAAGTGKVFRLYVDINQGDIGCDTDVWTGSTRVTEDKQTVVVVQATQLFLVTQPGDTTAGTPLNDPAGLRVEARRGDNSIDTAFNGAITALIESGPGTFTGASNNALQAVAGVVIFQNMAVDTVGAYTLRFTAAPLTSVVTASFQVAAGQPYRVVIIDQPGDGVIGQPIPPPPSVEVQDRYGNLSTQFNGSVSAALLSNPGGGTLLNTQAVAVGGVATFPNLQINKAGAGYSLIFTSAGIAASGGSDYFAMAVGAPAQLVVTQQPASVAGGALIVPLPRVQV
ncbi:MAG: hypothetical protein IT462_07290, partial [Planctomycetes bacterium]|nr:hypothetical protein [Planctomycetota bacterium]